MNAPTSDQALITLALDIAAGDDIDEDDRDVMTNALQAGLEEIAAVSEVWRLTTDELAGGAKGLGDSIGKLVLETLPKSVPAIVGFLKEWVSRPGSRPVTIKAQGNAGSVEVVFDPRSMSANDIEKLVSTLQAGVKEKA